MNQQTAVTDRKTGAEFSPIENELPLRWFRRLHLVPANGLGTGRRAIFLVLVTWLPIVLWAAAKGHLWNDATGEQLLQHYGVHVRCLVAIPLLVLAEAALHKASLDIVPQFIDSGLVVDAARGRFDTLLRDVRRLRDRSLPWVFVAGAALAWSLANRPEPHDDVLSWAVDATGQLGFGGAWSAYVVRPIFLALILGWFWRIILVAYFFWRMGRLELSIVPTHPDRAGGLAFVEKVPGAFAMVTFALSAMLASHWAHEIVHHAATLQSFKLPAVGFVALWTLFVLLPLFALAPALIAARGRAIPAYAALVGEQGRLVHRRWILRERIDDAAILDAPEIGPVADAASLYDAVKHMRTVPIGKGSIVRILVPIALPLIVVAMLRIPIKEVLLKLAKALI